MHGFQIRPGGVDIYILFDGTVSATFIDQTLQAWSSLRPKQIEVSVGEHLEKWAATTVLISQDSMPQLREKYPHLQYVLAVADAEVAQERLTVEITLRMLEQLAGSVTLFHAAALGNPQTREAMVLVGPSGRGKTTASKFLGQTYPYLSDETSIVQNDFRLRPYPKPLSIITEGHKAKQQIDPASLGIATVDPADFSFELKHLILLDRQEQATTPRFERVDMADALIDIVQQTSGLVRTDNGLHRLMELIAHCGGALRLVYSEISETLPQFSALFEGSLQLPAETLEIQSDREPSSGKVSEDQLTRYPGTAGYLVGERMLITHDDRLVEISTFSGDIWIELKEALTAADLKSRLEEFYGPIPEPDFMRVLEHMKQSQIIC